jgi:hypothetical protein
MEERAGLPAVLSRQSLLATAEALAKEGLPAVALAKEGERILPTKVRALNP